MNKDKKRNAVRLAVIGCGCVAEYGHMPSIAASDDWNCVAYADVNRERAEYFAGKFGKGDVYTDYRAVLDRKDVDAVAVLTRPVGTHCAIAVSALSAGKHVFTEKPISDSVKTGEKMTAAARQSGRKLFVGFLLRHTAAYKKMAAAIHAGMIGRPAVYRMICFERYRHAADSFAWKRALDFIRDTSPGFDCGSHYVDLMRWFSGAEAVAVQGMGARINPDVPKGCFDWESFHIELNDGSRGIYEVGWGFSFPPKCLVREAIGPKGRIFVRMAETEEGNESGAETVFQSIENDGEQLLEKSGWKVFVEEWAHFARMIYEDLDPYPALNDALASVRIVEAAHYSALHGGKLIGLADYGAVMRQSKRAGSLK